MAFADIQLEMSLTGHKTWRGFAPFINGGFGVVADVRGDSDVGNYRFGVPLAITLGTGVSWTPGGNWSVRLDWSAIAAARGWFAGATAIKGDDLIAWSSSEVPQAGFGLFDFLAAATVERWIREKVLLAPATVTCSVPGGIFAMISLACCSGIRRAAT